MRRAGLGLFVSLALIVCALGIGVATAKPPTGMSSVTINAAPNPVVYGAFTHIAGQAVGKKSSGATITLWARPVTSASFTKVATKTATSTGHYSFTIAPSLNTIYHVTAKTAPEATSVNKLVGVRVKITLGVSKKFPLIGTKVRFFGTVTPAYNGRFAVLQRQTATGGWVKVTRVLLVPGTSTLTVFGSTARSKYGKKVKVFVTRSYRVHFNPADGRYLANNSPVRVVIPVP